MTARWQDEPVVGVLIMALHKLDALAAELTPYQHLLWQDDPEAVIGQIRAERGQGLVHVADIKYATNGGSAAEACLEALNTVRRDWIEGRVKEKRDAEGWPERYHCGARGRDGDDPTNDYAEQLEDEQDTVDVAITEWRRVRANAEKAMAA